MSTTNEEIAQERREECRQQVRRYLAERQACAFHPRVIQRRLNEGHAHDFTEQEVVSACTFLVEHEAQVKVVQADLGAIRNYQATSAGVLAHERSGV